MGQKAGPRRTASEKVIKDIRNTFAHSSTALTFKSAALEPKFQALTGWTKDSHPHQLFRDCVEVCIGALKPALRRKHLVEAILKHASSRLLVICFTKIGRIQTVCKENYMSSNRSMSLEYDDTTAELLEELKEFFGVKSEGEVVQRALAVTRSIVRLADANHMVTITEPGTNDKIKLGL